MSDLVQKIADAVEVALGDDGHCVVYKNAAVKEAIRQSLGSTQERGEAVGEIIECDDGQWIPLWRDGTPAPGTVLYAHPPAADARVAELEREITSERELFKTVSEVLTEVIADRDRLEAQLTASREREGRMRAFIEEVSKQTPEKPDYWSSCSQCSHNQSDAEDIIDALAADKGEK